MRRWLKKKNAIGFWIIYDVHKAEREEMVFEIDGGEKKENEGEKER